MRAFSTNTLATTRSSVQITRLSSILEDEFSPVRQRPLSPSSKEFRDSSRRNLVPTSVGETHLPLRHSPELLKEVEQMTPQQTGAIKGRDATVSTLSTRKSTAADAGTSPMGLVKQAVTMERAAGHSQDLSGRAFGSGQFEGNGNFPVSPKLSQVVGNHGAGYQSRTDDLLITNQLLYH
jgi:hypothetical protein